MSWTELTQHPDFPLWILLFGLFLAAVAVFLIWRKIRFFRHSAVAPAQVTSFDKRSAMEGNVWRSVVEFNDAQGTTRQLEYIGSGAYPPFARAKGLKVHFDPQNPEKAYAYDFWKVWSAALAVSGAALFVILLGLGQLYFQAA